MTKEIQRNDSIEIEQGSVVEVRRDGAGRWRVDCVDYAHVVMTVPDGGLACSCGQIYPPCRHMNAVLEVGGEDDEAVIAADRERLRRRRRSMRRSSR